jgi:uncharacterized damage-inducible protein DinB
MPGMVAATSNEKETLIGYLEQQRYVVRLSSYGLSDEQAAATPTISALSVGGLVKHLTAVERFWMQVALDSIERPESEEAGAADYQSGFRLLAEESLAEVLDRYAEAASETDRIIRSFPDLSVGVPVPGDVPWFPKDVESWSIRWIVLHLIEETARHAGHADIVREGVDGASAFPLMAAAEGWPATPWMQPWEPAAAN